jgi:hypothetical protein
MVIIEQLQEKNEFLKKAYEVANNHNPASPLSVDINPIVFGKSIGFDEDTSTRIMIELVNDGFVNGGLDMCIVTREGLDYLRKLEFQNEKTPSINFKVGDNSTVQFQHGTTNSNQINMKQSEKLDIILRALYETKDSGRHTSIYEICKKLNIPLAIDEGKRLAHRLQNDGYVKATFLHHDSLLILTTHGIDYCEQDSYTYSGNAIIKNQYNISVVNSPNSNIVNQSQNVTINQNYSEIQKTINTIRETVKQDATVDPNTLLEILECLNEIEESIKNGNKPKFAIKSLIGLVGDISSITGLAITLAQFAGIAFS